MFGDRDPKKNVCRIVSARCRHENVVCQNNRLRFARELVPCVLQFAAPEVPDSYPSHLFAAEAAAGMPEVPPSEQPTVEKLDLASVLKNLDANQDGQLTKEELPTPAPM